MQQRNRFRFSIVPLALCALVAVADAQGRGQGNERAKENQGRADRPATSRGAERAKPQQDREESRANRARNDAAQVEARAASRGNSRAAAARSARDGSRGESRGNSASAPRPNVRALERASSNARFKRTWTASDIRPELRTRLSSDRFAERIAAGALAHAFARDVRGDAFVITPSGRQMLVRNRAGDVLVALDENRARNLGGWKVRPLHDRLSDGSPAFCRSGAGHPQWGRQWCIDKGFGIGVVNDVRWGRNLDASDVVFLREPTSATLTRAALASVLGERTVDRLALHAITLGLVDPLVGTWRTDPAGTRVLAVNSGAYPVAEIVDVDGDRRSDRMVVALRPW